MSVSGETPGVARLVERPEFFQAYTAADPGSRDLFGLVFAYWDFLNARLVVEKSWAQRNASTRKVAAIVAAYEFLLWGRKPHPKMGDIPLTEQNGKLGWTELLRGEEVAHLAGRLFELASGSGRLQTRFMTKPADCASFWDGDKFVIQPYHRATDVDVRMVQDLSIEYGMLFSPTAKDDAEAQRNVVRDAFGAGKILIAEDAGPIIEHVKNAEWNEKRTDYERHPIYGHYDCLAALIYLYRNVSRNVNPNPPQWVGTLRTPEVASHPWHKNATVKSGVAALQEHLMGRSW